MIDTQVKGNSVVRYMEMSAFYNNNRKSVHLQGVIAREAANMPWLVQSACELS